MPITSKLRSLLVVVGAAAIGGTTYLLTRPRPSATFAALADAGITADCEKVQLQCRVRVAPECRDLPDGGRRAAYGTVRTGAYLCGRDGGSPVLIARWTRQAGVDCFDEVGEDACRILEEGCTDSTVCDDANPRAAAVTDECWCRRFDAGACRWLGLPDGGPLQMGRGNVHPGPVQGPGCVPAPCVERAGEQGQGLPPECR